VKIDSIAIIDCGGQYTKVIDRKVRELSVKSDIFPIKVNPDKLKGYEGIILSGGPASVWSKDSLKYNHNLFKSGRPILGICYGMHLINHHFGGRIKPGIRQEYGQTQIKVDPECLLFHSLKREQTVLMSHGDSVEKMAPGFSACGFSDGVIAAIHHKEKKIFGVQFHPEVDLTENGKRILENFLKIICGLKGNYVLEDRIETAIKKIKEQVGNEKIIVLVSGGVDSAVSAALLLKALKKEQVYAIHVDHGFMRKNESDIICGNLKELGLQHLMRINAEDIFYKKTIEDEGRTLGPIIKTIHPEEKRNIIGHHFIHVIEKAASELGLDFNRTFLAQGTLRPDLIESGNPDVSGYAQKIKTHHNDIELIRKARAKGLVVETNWDWHKDEVRKIAGKLGIKKEIARRQPFPGPGLAIRFICSDGKNHITKTQETQLQGLIKNTPYRIKPVSIKTVGVQGDCRSYRYLSLLYGEKLNTGWDRIFRLGLEIPNKVSFINRVGYILNRSSLEEDYTIHPAKINKKDMTLLRELDARVREYLELPQISQVLAVLLPFGKATNFSVAIRAFVTKDYMTGRPAVPGKEIEVNVLEGLIERIEKDFPQIDCIIYDVTGKPPATVEWE
jgi:GMP synthase (glutamine-hydrolysing)